MPSPAITIVAPSGVVPVSELDAGVARLRAAGQTVQVPLGLDEVHFVFAGTDGARAKRFWDAAWREDSQILWAARGGYGAARLLPELERLTLADGTPPKKLLCGYSDITALHEFVRSRWGWSTLHCSMPAAQSFLDLPEAVFQQTLALATKPSAEVARASVNGSFPVLTTFGPEPLIDLVGTLVGGNMTVLASMVGTPFSVDNAGGRFLFLEDVSEAPYRIDRYLHQLLQAGVFTGVRAVLLGTFYDCIDAPPTTGPSKTPVRPQLSQPQWARHVWAEFSHHTKIPVLATLPVGHGPEKVPLPLGAPYRLTGTGELQLLSWDWTD